MQKFPFVLLSIYFGKLLWFPATWTDVGIFLILGGTAAFYEAWSQLKLYQKQIDEIRRLSDRVEKFEKMEQELRTHVASLKLGTQMRGNTNVR